MRILGVDPGSRITGYGLIETGVPHARALTYGTLRPPAGADMPDKLLHLHRGLRAVVEEHQPELVAVETAFFHKNAHSTLILGQVRGALIVSARDLGADILDVSPREVKMSVTGNGASTKTLVQSLVRGLLRLAETPTLDETDALAVALCAWRRSGSRIPG
jgi:crossover junction endodeoxyribonuclease RuvC